MSPSKKRTALVLSAALAGIINSAHAVTYTWNASASGNWSNPANWSGATLPVAGNTNLLQFSSPLATTYTATNDLASPFLLRTLIAGTFSGPAASLTIAGNPLEFQSSDPVAAPDQIVLNAGNLSLNSNLVFDNDTLLGSSNTSAGVITLSGATSGPAKLIHSGGRTTLNSTLGNSGGLEIRSGTFTVGASGNLGSAPITFFPTALTQRLVIPSAANAQDGTINTTGGYVQFTTLDQAALGKLNPASAGVLALPGSFSAPLNLTNLPTLRIGTFVGSSSATTVTLSSPITPGGNTYYFGGTDTSGTAYDTSDILSVSSLLTDGPSLQGRSVNIGSRGTNYGGRVRLTNNSNSFSGGITIGAGSPLIITALSINSTATAGQTPLGTGDVTVFGTLLFEGAAGAVGALPNNFIFKPESTLLFNNIGAENANRWPDAKPINLDGSGVVLQTSSTVTTPTETVGAVSFNDPSGITIDARGTTVTTLKVDSLARVNRGTLLLSGLHANAFGQAAGGTERFQITNGSSIVNPTTGMVAPYIIGDDTTSATAGVGLFLSVDGTGTFRTQPTTAFNSASEDEVVGLTANTTINDEIVHALRMPPSFSLTINPTRILTIKSGGLIMGGNATTTTTNGTIAGGVLNFQQQGLIFVNNRNATIASSIIGTQGIIKFGGAGLFLSGDNDFSGGLFVQEGQVRIASAKALNNGNQPNPVFLAKFGGMDFNGFSLMLHSLTGSGSIVNRLSATISTLTLDTPSDLTFGGAITSVPDLQGGELRIDKTGAGTLTLSGALFSTGLISASQGAIVMSGSDIYSNPFATAAGASVNFKANYLVTTIDGAGNTLVDPGITLGATHVRQNSLSIGSNASVVITQAGTTAATSRLNSFMLAGSNDNWQSTLDLKNNALIIDGGDLATTLNQIKSGLVSGRGIVGSAPGSAFRLGAIRNDNGSGGALYSDFRGISGLDGDEVLVRYTYVGDVNLDGTVSISDFIDLASNFTKSGGWREGDLNYDGLITISDFIDLASNFGQSLAGSAQPTESDWQMLTTFADAHGISVPEPHTLLVANLAALVLCARRRRRQ